MTYTLYHFQDPMCSWCWGYQPEWDKLERALPSSVQVQYVLGGLAPDSDEPMPPAMQQTIAGFWRKIEAELGTEFNHDFWTNCQPKRSTYPACRAVIAARRQNSGREMFAAIQQAYYLRAMNPSETETLVQLADELGLDVDRFKTELSDAQTEQTLQNEVAFTRRMPIRGFPSLVLESGQKLIPVPVDYKNHKLTLGVIQQQLQ